MGAAGLFSPAAAGSVEGFGPGEERNSRFGSPSAAGAGVDSPVVCSLLFFALSFSDSQRSMEGNLSPFCAFLRPFLPAACFTAAAGSEAGGAAASGEAEEAINTPFCPLREKTHTFVLRGLRNISEAP